MSKIGLKVVFLRGFAAYCLIFEQLPSFGANERVLSSICSI